MTAIFIKDEVVSRHDPEDIATYSFSFDELTPEELLYLSEAAHLYVFTKVALIIGE